MGMSGPQSPKSAQASRDLSDLEQTAPPTPTGIETVAALQSWNWPAINKWRLLAACAFSLANGLNDSAPGALLPYIERHYDIEYAIVSLIFVTQAVGFLTAAPLTHFLEARIGRARAYMLAAFSNIICYVVVICQPPWGLVVAVYIFNGFGIALNLALNQVWCANLVNATTILGALHGFYGLGATVAPLAATAMASHGVRWSYYFSIPLFLQLSCLFLAGWSFRGFEDDSAENFLNEGTELNEGARRSTVGASREDPTSKAQNLKKAVRERSTLLGSLFIFAYQGAEVSISGWIITFLIKYRHGDPSRVGYVTAGFWGGVTIGRFALSHVAHKIGEKVSVVALTAGAAAFQLLAWFLPNVIGDGVAVSIVGLLLGPVYPCSMAIFSRLLSRSIQMSSLSIISAMGSSGGAVAPFVTGIMAQKFGTVVLHPIVLVLLAVMEASWLALPRIQKRTD